MPLWLGPVIALALSASEAPPIRLQLEAGLRCELNRSLYRALTEQHLQIAAANDESAWVLAVGRDGDAVWLRVTNPQGVVRGARRLNPTAADCVALPSTVALLVKSWLGMQLSAPKPPPPVIVVEARPPVVRVRPEKPRPAPPVVASSVDPPLLAAPPEIIAPDAPDFVVEQPAPLPPREGSGPSLAVMLAGGGALSYDDSAVAMGMLTLEWGFLEPWGVALDGGLETERRWTHASGGAVTASLRWAGLSLRRAFFGGLHVSLGLQLVHMRAAAHDFAVVATRDVFVPGAALNVEWRQPLTAGLFLLARLNVQARLQPQSFTIDGARVGAIPPWGFGLEGGVGWSF